MSRIAWNHAPDTGNTELTEFLDALLDAVQSLDAQAVQALPAVTQTAGATYTANEQLMLNNLKALVNGIKGAI
jgi:hypothetical protein